MSLVLTPEGTPASPVEGEVYYDSTADKLKVRDASAFREVVSKNSSGEIDGTFSGTIGSSATFPADSVVQFESGITDTVSGITNTSAPGDSWLEKAITPKYSNSKILIQISFVYSKEDGYTGYTRLYRNTTGGSNTWIYPYTSDRGYSLRGSSPWGVDLGFIQYVDTPGSGTHTYKCYSYTSNSGHPIYINKNYNNSQDANSGGRASSSIVLMEIKV